MKHLMATKLLLTSLVLLLNACFMMNINVNTAFATDNTLPVYANEEPSGYNAVAVNGEWYIKLRDICDIYFVEIDYDDATKTITIYDEPTPTKMKLLGDKVAEEKEMFVENGSVYGPLKNSGILTFKDEHKQQGHLDVRRTFSFNNGFWSIDDKCPQIGDYKYAIFARTSDADLTLNKDYVWQFKPNGRCRAVAVYLREISSFVIDCDDIFIVGNDTWNASSVVKFSLIDGTETRLGQLGYDYGDNLSRTMFNSLSDNNIEPLPHTGIVVRDDGVYTVGYSQKGFFENNIIDKNIFLDTYGYYRLSRDGGAHEKVAEWPQ